jgi:hypothetical protein
MNVLVITIAVTLIFLLVSLGIASEIERAKYVVLGFFVLIILESVLLFVGVQTKEIKYQQVNVIEQKRMADKSILQLEDNTVLVKNEIAWLDAKIVYKKIRINYFGDTIEDYVISKK